MFGLDCWLGLKYLGGGDFAGGVPCRLVIQVALLGLQFGFALL